MSRFAPGTRYPSWTTRASPKGKVIPGDKALTPEEQEAKRHLQVLDMHDRPKTRGDCVDGERPCPWAACRHHMAIEVSTLTGALKVNFPDLEAWEIPETCSLDVADRGDHPLEEVGELMNIVRERVRQVEVIAIRKLKRWSEK